MNDDRLANVVALPPRVVDSHQQGGWCNLGEDGRHTERDASAKEEGFQAVRCRKHPSRCQQGPATDDILRIQARSGPVTVVVGYRLVDCYL